MIRRASPTSSSSSSATGSRTRPAGAVGRERRRLAADKARAETFYARARGARREDEELRPLAKSDGRVDKERRRLDEVTAECASLKQRPLKSQ